MRDAVLLWQYLSHSTWPDFEDAADRTSCGKCCMQDGVEVLQELARLDRRGRGLWIRGEDRSGKTAGGMGALLPRAQMSERRRGGPPASSHSKRGMACQDVVHAQITLAGDKVLRASSSGLVRRGCRRRHAFIIIIVRLHPLAIGRP